MAITSIRIMKYFVLERVKYYQCQVITFYIYFYNFTLCLIAED